jgi:hypothetical protein
VELHVVGQLRQQKALDMPGVTLGYRVLDGKQVLENLLVLHVDRFDPDRKAVVPLHRVSLR